MQKELRDEIEKMKVALTEAIADAEGAEEITYNGFDGQLLSKAGGNYTYQFMLKTYWDIDDNAKIYVVDEERTLKIDARVLSREATNLMIVTRMALPTEQLSHLLFLEDKTWLLKRQLQALTNFTETAAEFGAKTLGLLPVKSSSKVVRGKLGNFVPHPNQEKAIAHGLGSELTLIVGPPGTGKTTTLSDLICRYLRQGLSVLLVSHTNIATDNAFIRLIQAMKDSKKTDLKVLIEQGLAVRAGDPRHVALRSGAYRGLTVNALAEARMGKQKEARELLEKALHEQGQQIEELEDNLRQQEAAWPPQQKKLQEKVEDLRQELSRLQAEQAERERKDREFLDTKAGQRKDANALLARLQKESKDLEDARTAWATAAQQRKEAWEDAVTVDMTVRAMGKVKRWFSPYSNYDFAVAEQNIASLHLARQQADTKVVELDKQILENQTAQMNPSVEIALIDRDVQSFHNIKALGDHPDVARIQQLEGELASQEEKLRQGEQKISDAREQVKQRKEEQDRIAARIEELKAQQESFKQQIVAEAQLVATTITSVYLNAMILESEFDVVVIDEVSMISIIGVLLAASCATQHLVGGGDPMQLAPIVKLEHEDKALQAKEWLSKDLFSYLGISIFDAINGDKECVLLTEQGRTHPVIIAPINHYIYQDMLTSRDETSNAPGIAPHPAWPLLLADTTHTPAQCLKPSRNRARENEYHARLAVVLARQSLESLPLRPPGDDPSVPRIAIIAPYRSQVQLIQRKLREAGIGHLVHVGTINTVQSLEFPVVIFDTVEAPGMKPWAFTFDMVLDKQNMATDATRKLNVAWTRARYKLIVIAHQKHLHDHLPRLHPVDDPAKKQRLLVDLVDWAGREGYIDAASVLDLSPAKK